MTEFLIIALPFDKLPGKKNNLFKLKELRKAIE